VTRVRESTSLTLDLTDAERATLVWAVEVAYALRSGNPEVEILLGDPAISTERLDELADRLVLLGKSSGTAPTESSAMLSVLDPRLATDQSPRETSWGR
jgi:hypothetical protein